MLLRYTDSVILLIHDLIMKKSSIINTGSIILIWYGLKLKNYIKRFNNAFSTKAEMILFIIKALIILETMIDLILNVNLTDVFNEQYTGLIIII